MKRTPLAELTTENVAAFADRRIREDSRRTIAFPVTGDLLTMPISDVSGSQPAGFPIRRGSIRAIHLCKSFISPKGDKQRLPPFLHCRLISFPAEKSVFLSLLSSFDGVMQTVVMRRAERCTLIHVELQLGSLAALVNMMRVN
jgi:hypothetical protein